MHNRTGHREETRFWLDLRFVAHMAATPFFDTVHRVDFQVWEYCVGTKPDSPDQVTWYQTKDSPTFDVTEDREQAIVYLSGYTMWDGIVHVHFDAQEDLGMLSFSNRQDAARLAVLLDRLYDLAAEIMPEHATNMQ
jgi:hypothetical protein